ncbi:hypothetical protein RclHR1_07780005 [Rhizophagus clarus]|uniref:Uncharacterized protein n=1 Tax=Rhizophagus clarus TaxID=94130 RepID=A0A2Z6SLR2_9GLOM|nr:hypothetical protein RclHR1_07780005 [Rhizophagus clarus]GET02696.1 hypothetical protein GLOIN_2v1807857 [Rhizophagus clarus]
MDDNNNSDNNEFNQPPTINQVQTENSYNVSNNNDSFMLNNPANPANTARNTSSSLPQSVLQNDVPPQLNFSQTNNTGIFTFNIPGLKIIIIPTFSPSNSEIFTLDIPDSKIVIIILSLQ